MGWDCCGVSVLLFSNLLDFIFFVLRLDSTNPSVEAKSLPCAFFVDAAVTPFVGCRWSIGPIPIHLGLLLIEFHVHCTYYKHNPLYNHYFSPICERKHDCKQHRPPFCVCHELLYIHFFRPAWLLESDENEACGIKTFDSVRLIGLDSTLLVCTHCLGGHCKLATQLLPRLCEPDWIELDSTLLVCTHPNEQHRWEDWWYSARPRTCHQSISLSTGDQLNSWADPTELPSTRALHRATHCTFVDQLSAGTKRSKQHHTDAL